jgi:ribosomal 50S subunit-recycling heat shock protein
MRLNSRAVKRAGQPIRIGDVLRLPTRDDIAAIPVVDLGARHGPASEAATFYEHIQMLTNQSEQPAHKRSHHTALSGLASTGLDRKRTGW